jgi:signal transduction histidine kinase
VPAALLIVDAAGRVELANAAARRLAGEDMVRLDQMAAVGPDAAARILAIAPGGREIVRLADGRQMLGSVLRFQQPDAAPERLIALQDVAVALDAVQVQAWQDLVRVLAHEMLNSLTPISALAESLQARGGLDADTAASIEVIARRSLGLMDFVDRYRKVAEMPAPSRQSIDVGAFIADLERLLRPAMAAAGVAFECAAVPPGLTVEADRQLLEQAAINLVKNAREAVAGQADAKVTLACRAVDERVEIAVIDNGPGLSAEVLDRLFVPFFTTKPGGSGIGLSLARQIALAHHGQLEAGPASPRGAVFTLVLPAIKPPARRSDPPSRP